MNLRKEGFIFMSEQKRLLAHRKRKANWKQWGPYLSERAWGTVREDYGQGSPWESFPFEQAHKRPFRWGEDGLGGFCDRLQSICMAFSFWNGEDPILKERLFGLTPLQGNHGEDVKECYYYLDATPTSSYCKMLYRYPQKAFPYKQLRFENQKRGLNDPEFELNDTGIFDEERFFDILIEHAKEDREEIVIRLTATNLGPSSATLTILPTIWFRNTWKWGYENGLTGSHETKPHLFLEDDHLKLNHALAGSYYFYVKDANDYLFCENDQDMAYSKDAFHRFVIHGETGAVNPEKKGTKATSVLTYNIEPKKSVQILCRLTRKKRNAPFHKIDKVFKKRIEEADHFYTTIQNPNLSNELCQIQRQAFAGLLFSKQFYYLDQHQWLKGDPNYPSKRTENRNQDWEHLASLDLLSMPDKWEYPYFCGWDSAFHCIPMVLVDPDFAKRQLTLMTREWYMHPNGQFPAYEWAFSDVNPPVHAWALWRTYKIDAKKYGKEDRPFLEANFHKLLLNFTWWVNKKDTDGNNVFQGGFLGMDNISVFNRSRDLPTGGHIDQSDGTAWMSFFCISMIKIAVHLAEIEPIYQDMATKFFEHFLRIASAMTKCGGKEGESLWDEEDGFFYDLLHSPKGEIIHLKVRSLVGLLPLLAVETIEPNLLEKMPVFKRRMSWFVEKRPDVSCNLPCLFEGGSHGRRLLSIVTKDQLTKILHYMLDEEEFLSPYGIRSVSKYHEKNPYSFNVNSNTYEVKYIPAESNNEMFGGNSNWRGPIWFPINFLLIEALQRFHHYYGDDFKVEFPTGSGNFLNLWDVAKELSTRLIRIFLPDESGKRPVFGSENKHPYVLFHEYFHGETGRGLGASHQTGWTALIAKLIQQSGELF